LPSAETLGEFLIILRERLQELNKQQYNLNSVNRLEIHYIKLNNSSVYKSQPTHTLQFRNSHTATVRCM